MLVVVVVVVLLLGLIILDSLSWVNQIRFSQFPPRWSSQPLCKELTKFHNDPLHPFVPANYYDTVQHGQSSTLMDETFLC